MLSILQKYWNYPSFRGVQKPIIDSICQGRDTLGLMPTGGGKSITFQVPALSMDGLCLVITPLVSLMRDQVQHLLDKGIKAAFLHAEMKQQDIVTTLDSSIFGAYKFLYVSPERLSSPLFQSKLSRMKVCLITVDEAHCISQWGHDFRPSYLNISQVRDILPDVPILALTATAIPKVIEDIQDSLHFRQRNVISMSFARNNLAYEVRRVEADVHALFRLLSATEGSTIIYSSSRRRCEGLSRSLTEAGFSSTFFHAGLQDSEKKLRQRLWQTDQVRIIVATNAFGMGIDKPDVRYVIHIDIPDSIEAYFQEAGRAGRDGKPAKAILLCDGTNLSVLKRRPSASFPEVEFIRSIYDRICYFLQIAMGDGEGITRQFNLHEFCINYHYMPTTVTNALTFLSLAGYITYSSGEDNTSRLHILATRNELYHAIIPEHEPLFDYILRRYAGIFVEDAYIDEQTISQATGFSIDDIYHLLQRLSALRIVSYIPRKDVPLITFLCRRVDSGKIVFSEEVYARRKAEFIRKIGKMSEYVERTDICRSRFLLEYFGETTSEDCGMCDFCLRDDSHSITQKEYDALRQDIIAQLKGSPLLAFDLNLDRFPEHQARYVVESMVSKGELRIHEGYVSLNLKN